MIHQYKLNGYNVVIDVYSGAIHVVDDVAYDIIRLFCAEIDKMQGDVESLIEKISMELEGKNVAPAVSEDRFIDRIIDSVLNKYHLQSVEPEEFLVNSSDIIACCLDIIELYRSGKIFSADVFRPSASMMKERHTDIKALCLHVSHACDLTCSYCFAGQGRFNGLAALMTEEVAFRAIDFLIENSGDRHNLEVDFFGGEPLLNFDVVKSTVAYARSKEAESGKNFRFTLTTNGMGIDDEVIDFVNRECHNVVLSLDGRKEVHDRERRTADNKGSYDVIVPKFQRLVAARTGSEQVGGVKLSDIPKNVALGSDTGNTNYYMRGTFTHYNTDFTEDIFHMTELGFTELSMEPVVASPESEFALTDQDLPVLMEQYEILAKEMLRRDKPFTFYHYMLDLAGGPCIYKRISGCGSGTEYFAVTPQGELYPCHQFVGEPEYLVGDIWNGIVRTEIRDKFKMCNVYARPECENCWAKLYCSGGCAANAYHASGDILGTYDYGCELFKKRIECAIMMEADRAEHANQ